MSAFLYLKTIHVSCALLSVTGFAVRGYWRLVDHPAARHRLTRVLPHVIDTLLLASAVGMLVIWGVWPFDIAWLAAKLAALLLYIGLGMMVMRFANSQALRVTAYAAALAVATYILFVAYTKSALGPLRLLAD